MKFEVIVERKKEVLDAEGRAILSSLKSLGYSSVSDLKVSKRFLLEANSEKDVKEIADKILINPVSETAVIRHVN